MQNDVTAKDLKLAAREGFRSIEHVKRYTTTGMATDQGKTSNMNALGVVAAALDAPIPQVGLTTFRMPYTPVTFGSFAGLARGDLFEPVRKTPMHAGRRRRARCSSMSGCGSAPAISRARARTCTRRWRANAWRCATALGMFDATTLGKIEVVGPDAAEFMNRMYVNALTRLGVGRCRYGVLLREDGFVCDDGVVGRLAADRFHVTTTTGGAARVLGMMEDYLQTEWPELKVWLTSTTEQWAVIAVQGPKAREVLAPLVEGHRPRARGVAAYERAPRAGSAACRCGCSASASPASSASRSTCRRGMRPRCGSAIAASGAAHGITPYGTEAMHVLRAEKGYIIVGQDTDGTVTPDDAGLGWAVGKIKPDFVGKRSLMRAAMQAAGPQAARRPAHGGSADRARGGCAARRAAAAPPPMPLLGHVTSSYFSATLGRSIALAMVADGRARMGARLFVPMPGGAVPVQVTAPVFYDPEGTRLDG